MTRTPVPIGDLTIKPHHLWANQWMLLTSGDFVGGRYNTMAAGWGSIGTMWGKPFAQVVVRPTRHTYRFMEEFDSFTLCAFPEKHRKSILMLGTKSGSQCNKIAESGLTPIGSTRVSAPGFAEAELIIECRKIYWDDFDPARFLAPDIEANYPNRDYHRLYYGEILAVSATDAFRSAA